MRRALLARGKHSALPAGVAALGALSRVRLRDLCSAGRTDTHSVRPQAAVDSRTFRVFALIDPSDGLSLESRDDKLGNRS